MGSTVFYVGSAELATLSNTFTVNGTNTDPTTVTLVVTDPTGDQETYTQSGGDFTHAATGVYSINIPCTEAGTWAYEWTGTGAASDVIAGTWQVDTAPGSDLYCTPEGIKSRAGVTDRADDRELLGVCRSVSRWVDEWCDRVFARRTVTIQVDTCGYYSLPVPDLVSVTTLKTDDDRDGVFETTWSTTDYELQPVNAAVQLLPEPYTAIAAVGSRVFPIPTGYPGRPPRAQIVGVLGWPSLPPGVAEAAEMIGADYLAATGMKFGMLSFGDYAVRARMNGAALEMLRPHRKYGIQAG